jgi:hypothetical protein
MVGAPLSETTPARRLAVGGAVLALAMELQMERHMGLSAGTLHAGTPARLLKASRVLTVAGAVGSVVMGGRTRAAAALCGAALLAGSVCTRFAIFEAGQASARDPRYTVIPQRDRVNGS